MKPGCEKTVCDCINYQLGPSIVELTQLNPKAQNVELLNNVIRHSLPKNVTYPRNFSGRAISAVFKCNNGPGESLLRLCEASGCPIASNSKVSAGLLVEQKIFKYNRLRFKSMKRKLKRKRKRSNLFKIYEKNQEAICYKKPSCCKKCRNKRV